MRCVEDHLWRSVLLLLVLVLLLLLTVDNGRGVEEWVGVVHSRHPIARLKHGTVVDWDCATWIDCSSMWSVPRRLSWNRIPISRIEIGQK